VDRAVRILLKPTVEQTGILHETMRQFTESFNVVCRTGWEQHDGNAYTLHYLTYRHCKNTLPNLVSDLHIQARQKAAEATKSAITREKKGLKVGCPQSLGCPPRYNLHTYVLDWDKGIVNLSTTNGRMKILFNVPGYAKYAIGYPTATADLMFRKNKFYLHVVVGLPDVEFVSNGKAIGVDLGVTRLAVRSDNRFHGSRHMKEVVKRIFRLNEHSEMGAQYFFITNA